MSIGELTNTIESDQSLKKECRQKIIGYVTPNGGKHFTEAEAKHLTHAILAYVHLNSDGTIGPFDTQTADNAFTFAKLYELLTVKTRLLNTGHTLKTMVSVGGWNDSQHFPSIVGSPQKRSVFVSNMLTVIDYWNLDGIEIDWKYPVIGGVKPGSDTDRDNFVLFLTEIRQALDSFTRGRGRTNKLLLSITGASGVWMVDTSYDLESIEPLVDWITLLTYDYFGPFKSKWGATTGPNAPLRPSAPISSLSHLSVQSTLEKYFCRLNSSAKLVLSIPFYGHYWNNVGQPIDTKDNHFRDAHPVGGFVTYDNIKDKWLSNRQFEHLWHNKSSTPYLWSETQRVFLAYDDPTSVAEKVRFAIAHRLAGVALWTLDFDDGNNQLLSAIGQSYTECQKNNVGQSSFECQVTIKKWWSADDGSKDGLCGRSAPLIDGFYPICNPNNQSMHCCSPWGRCGSGPEFCDCESCVNYKRDPNLIEEHPLRPNRPIRWLTSDQLPSGKESEGVAICGPKSVIKVNGSDPTCNGDDPNAHCCSADGLCGSGPEYCKCEHCVDFTEKPDFTYMKKIWWDESDGPMKGGRCGRLAPKINDTFAICNPLSSAYCCGKWGLCGSGPLNCQCIGCVDFKKKPNFRWKTNY